MDSTQGMAYVQHMFGYPGAYGVQNSVDIQSLLNNSQAHNAGRCCYFCGT